jgi:predicted NAD-dependent protein-ADP-ribosyltransferase YbiA (DUF1768 family)
MRRDRRHCNDLGLDLLGLDLLGFALMEVRAQLRG